MLRLQAFKFALQPNGEQLRNLRQFAGSCRLVYNKGLALNLERYEKKEQRLGYAGLCALLPNPYDGRTVAELIEAADRQLYKCKRAENRRTLPTAGRILHSKRAGR